MALLWSNDLLTGNVRIDKQHKELMDRLGRFLAALESGINKKEVAQILGYLSKYVVSHFENEETLMANRRYPGVESHKREHTHLKEALSVLATLLENTGVTIGLVAQTHQTVYDWLKNHIHKEDKKFAAFLKEQSDAYPHGT